MKYTLILLPDGDIEIWTVKKDEEGDWEAIKRVRHRSYNLGDKLFTNLTEEYIALQKLEKEEAEQ